MSSDPDAGSSRPSRRSAAMPSAANSYAGLLRAANTRATRSASSRRAANSRASADAASSQCASSTTPSTTPSSAAALSIDNVATPTRNGSTGAPSCSPNATRSVRAWGPGRCSCHLPRGRSNRCSDPKASGDSTSRPCVRTTCAPSATARATRSSTSADLPTPGSPRTTTDWACPCRARSTRAARYARSTSRPCSTVRPYCAGRTGGVAPTRVSRRRCQRGRSTVTSCCPRCRGAASTPSAANAFQ